MERKKDVRITTNKAAEHKKALSSVGSSLGAWYFKPKPLKIDRGMLPDPSILLTVKELALRKRVYAI